MFRINDYTKQSGKKKLDCKINELGYVEGLPKPIGVRFFYVINSGS